jgi:hypothetical protein|tara:strand:+ start:560 stop:763 length:204 start_codon:yes stop_codon:yes gene_type:complete
MGGNISVETYERRIESLEKRVLELEQKVFLDLDDKYIHNHNFLQNKSDEHKIHLVKEFERIKGNPIR